MKPPLVSVVIPAYNHAPYVERSIRSVLDQTYGSIELIVVDDGSTDDTWDVIQRVHAASGGSFMIYRKPNGGVSSTLNFGIRRSSGVYVAVLASDDYFALEKIERQVELFLASPPVVGMVHSNAYDDFGGGKLVSTQGRYTPAVGACFRELLSLQVGAVAPTAMFRRDAYDRVGGFDESLAAEDVDFYVGLAAKGYEFRHDPAPLVYKTVTGQNLTARVDRSFACHLATLSKHAQLLSPEERLHVENAIYRAMGRSAAGAGMLRLSWQAYSSLAVRTRSVRPYLSFLNRSARHLVLSFLPGNVRHVLRDVRDSRGSRRVLDSARAAR
ncbi:MAG TPA: glycosyltransferase family A protein [Longimicrobiaceae bacterium]|jgi:GT2 family glycosyltransferase